MTRRRLIAAVLTCIAAVPIASYAHEGHAHTIRGTVTQLDDKQVTIKTTEGKSVTVLLNAKTTVLRDAEKLERAAIQIGLRAVVDVGDGKAPLVAKSVKLAAPAAAKAASAATKNATAAAKKK